MQFVPPPRRVPPSLMLLSLFNGWSQIGWFVFGFGMIFFWVFAGNADLSLITFRGEIAEVPAKVVKVEETGASENETTVYANHYQFSAAGQTFTGTSYSTGSRATEGEEVRVQYKPGNPLRSRIAGMRRAQFGPFALIVVIFPFIGFVFVYFAHKHGFRRIHLLRTGLLTTGRLVGKEPTNMTVNDRRVYELTYEFTARDGQKCKATASSSDTTKLEDDESEPLLYDPEDTTCAYLLDEAPSRPEIDGTGQLVGRPIPALLSAIIPGIVIAAHVLYLTR